MSWQAYVDTQMIQKNLKQAAIAGHDGNIWAKVHRESPPSVHFIWTLDFLRSIYLAP